MLQILLISLCLLLNTIPLLELKISITYTLINGELFNGELVNGR